jgi:hypothetical protein
VRLQLHALAYNLGNFLRTFATQEPIKDWSLDELEEANQDRLEGGEPRTLCRVPNGGGRYPTTMLQEILRLIAELRPQPAPAPA